MRAFNAEEIYYPDFSRIPFVSDYTPPKINYSSFNFLLSHHTDHVAALRFFPGSVKDIILTTVGNENDCRSCNYFFFFAFQRTTSFLPARIAV